jgi:hypothetical protein
MYKSPELPAAPRVVTVFPEKAIDLWLKALERPEADLKCKAADAIALAHRRGVKRLERTIAQLRSALDRQDQHPTARMAAARTLIELDARKAAPSLSNQARLGSRQLRELVEPALAHRSWLRTEARKLLDCCCASPKIPSRASPRRPPAPSWRSTRICYYRCFHD